MKEYLLISLTSIGILVAQNPNWDIQPIETIYQRGNKPVYVVDGRWIDSLGLHDWTDIRVQYPINLNDSNNVHRVILDNNEIN
jgi:hypothetical protein